MGKIKRYLVDFTFTSSGTVLITGKNKAEAFKNLETTTHIWDQIEDQIDQTKFGQFDIRFDKRSAVEDEDEGSDPYTDYSGPDEEE